ncbi:MAG: family 20 glycosylhydrolase [Clostridia bacterium]|nr:family 20 glycosylhydrolase [Clostridia bacterium]
MNIGLLNVQNITYTHQASAVPFPPSQEENGACKWLWNDAYDSAIDAHYTLENESFVGAVSLKISEASVKGVCVLVDQKPCGAYRAETGKLTGGEINIPIGVRGREVIVRLETDLRDLTLEQVEILGACDDGAPMVYPTPKAIEFLDGSAKIKDVVSKNGDEDELFAAAFLKQRLTERFGDWQSSRGVVIVFDKTAAKTYANERYTVKCSQKKLTVTAQTRLTLLYGADTVLQLTEAKTGVRRFNCDDRPTKPFRGFHFGLPSREKLDFMDRVFRYVLVPLRYNTLFVEFAGSMRFDSHPEITASWEKAIRDYREGKGPRPPHVLAGGETLEKAEVARLIESARELGLEIVPEVQTLGHVQYITVAHPELAEIDEAAEEEVKDTRVEDARPDAKFHHCYCPSLEESYQIAFDLIDEIVDLVKPQNYVHIGHDEVYQVGVCKRCRQKDPAVLFAEHVTRLHDHIAKKGLKTVMWADMVQIPLIKPYRTQRAITMIPKDILLLDFVWYFKTDADIEDNLLKHKFRVGVGNLYSSHFPRYRYRVMKPNMVGGQISMWVECTEQDFGLNGKFWDTVYLSEMLWNTEGYDERNRTTYTEIIAKRLQPTIRDEIRGTYAPKGYRTKAIRLPKGAPAPQQLARLCPSALLLQGERITVGGTYERLVFEHATCTSAPRIMWVQDGVKIGDYVLTYSDGAEVEIPVVYAQNVMAYTTTYAKPMPQEYYRHNGYVGTWFSDPVLQGKTDDGADLTVYGFVWDNPHPEKEIASVVYRPVENDYCGLILAGIRGLNKK